MNRSKLIAKLTRVLSFLIIFYILFLLGRTLWTNYNLKKSIDKLNVQMATLTEQKRDFENLNLYYKSDSFRELEARKKLGLKKPGEKVMVLAATPTPQNFPKELEKEKVGISNTPLPSQISNWLLWWEFFTK